MNNIILGSGIIGLLAKALLPTWTVIPFKRSRFYSFNPALDDNFIIADPQTDEFMAAVSGALHVETVQYRRAWSVGGQLLKDWDRGLCESWLFKIFGGNIPPQSVPYHLNRMNHTIYNLHVNKLYKRLQETYAAEISAEVAKGPITEIGDHYLVRNGIKEDYDNMLSTIPLPTLRSLMQLSPAVLPARTLHYYCIETEALDFEGVNQQLVVDNLFAFYRVSQIGPKQYLFYCHEDVPSPGLYFMPILGLFDLLDGTSIVDALPMGPIPKLDFYETKDIFCVGKTAQWDWCMDVGSCILRLQRYAQRNFKPAKPVLMS